MAGATRAEVEFERLGYWAEECKCISNSLAIVFEVNIGCWEN